MPAYEKFSYAPICMVHVPAVYAFPAENAYSRQAGAISTIKSVPSTSTLKLTRLESISRPWNHGPSWVTFKNRPSLTIDGNNWNSKAKIYIYRKMCSKILLLVNYPIFYHSSFFFQTIHGDCSFFSLRVTSYNAFRERTARNRGVPMSSRNKARPSNLEREKRVTVLRARRIPIRVTARSDSAAFQFPYLISLGSGQGWAKQRFPVILWPCPVKGTILVSVNRLTTIKIRVTWPVDRFHCSLTDSDRVIRNNGEKIEEANLTIIIK